MTQGFDSHRGESFGSLGAQQRAMLQQQVAQPLSSLFGRPFGSMSAGFTPPVYKQITEPVKTFYSRLKEEITEWLKIAI